MNRSNIIATMVAVCIACAGSLQASDSTTIQLKLQPSGFASMEFGEIVKGSISSKTNKSMDHTFMKQINTGLSVKAALSERNSLTIGLGMQMYNNYPTAIDLPPQYRYLYYYPYLSQAEYSHTFGELENPYLRLSAGYFPFKYNNEVRNLGEYLFRTGTYPQYILNYFDFPSVRLMGMHAMYIPLKNLKVDMLFHSNLQWYAMGDWNLATIITYAIPNLIDVAIGGSLNSIISSDSTLTTPHNPKTLYHVSADGDSSYFTFRGSKLMARATIDLKKIIPSEVFGKEDLKIYGEAAILGLRDYPRNVGLIGYDPVLKKNTYSGQISYDSLMERIPMMVGLNIPVFKFLDVLSAEVEYFKSPYPNDIGALTQQGIPLPGSISEGGSTNYRAMGMYTDDNLKWSLYGTKTIARNYMFTFQVASDHLRSLAVNDQNVDFEEALHNIKQWYFMLKATVKF